MAMATAKVFHLPRRPQTVRRYLEIVRYAHEKKQGLTSVAKHFGISPATVINASKALGMTYEQVKQRRSLPELKLVEKQLASIPDIDPRTKKILEMYSSPAAPTLQEIGREVGLTRQRVHQIIREAQAKGLRVSRQTPMMGHWIARCQICRQLRALAARQPLLTTRGISQALNVPLWKVYWHLGKLRAQELVPKHFGHFRSERIIEAIKLYNRNQSLSAWKLGQQLGYKNLPALFRELKRRGFGYLLFPRTQDEAMARKLRFVEAETADQTHTGNKSWGRKTAQHLPLNRSVG